MHLKSIIFVETGDNFEVNDDCSSGVCRSWI